MIVIGIILLLVAYLLPDVLPVPPGVEHILTVLGWVGIVAGLILLLLGYFRGGPVVGNRRFWY